MSFRTVAIANGLVGVAYGAAILALPAVIASVYGIEITDREAIVVRLLGAAYLALGLVAWGSRGVADPEARAAIAVGQLAGWLLSLPVALVAQASGLGNAIGWSVPVLQVVFIVAWASVLFGTARGRP